MLLSRFNSVPSCRALQASGRTEGRTQGRTERLVDARGRMDGDVSADLVGSDGWTVGCTWSDGRACVDERCGCAAAQRRARQDHAGPRVRRLASFVLSSISACAGNHHGPHSEVSGRVLSGCPLPVSACNSLVSGASALAVRRRAHDGPGVGGFHVKACGSSSGLNL